MNHPCARSFAIGSPQFTTVWRLLLPVLGALAASLLHAAPPPPRWLAFEVPAGSAERTLKLLAEQGGVEVVFSTEIAGGVQTREVKGEFTVLDAVTRMLTETSLQATQKNPAAAVVVSRRNPARPTEGSVNGKQPTDPTAPAAPKSKANSQPSNANAPGAVANAADAVIELSPFTVSESGNVGYRAQNTLAGSRLNSSLKDTPGVLDVLTKEFLDDVGATTLEQALNFSANYETSYGDLAGSNIITSAFPGANQGLNFNTRGQGGALARNFLPTSFRPEYYTIERIDNSSGPNAILFGIGSAGGVANVSTKRARVTRDSYGVEFQFNSNNGKRATLDVNQVLVADHLALRVNGIANRGQGYRKYAFDELDGVQIAATWRLNDRTEIRVEYEQDHTTGTVIHPGASFERVSQWIAAGSTTVTVPVNWDTLTAAARTALMNTYAPQGIVGININSTVDRPVFVSGDQPFILNTRNTLVSNGTTIPTIDAKLIPYDVNTSGPGGRKQINRELLALSADQRLAKNLYLNLSAARESGNAYTYQSFPGTGGGTTNLTADPNATINNASQLTNLGSTPFTTNSAGQIINPNTGAWYLEGRWRQRLQSNFREIAQASLAWQFDAGRLGSHQLVGNVSYAENQGDAQQLDEQWLNAPFNNTVSNVNNAVIRRQYVKPGVSYGFHAPDPLLYQNLAWEHPTRGRLTSGWVPIDSTKQNFRDQSALIAAQSYFFNRRFVTTIGIREDEQTSYQYLSYLVKPPGYEATNGYPIIDHNSAVSQTSAKGTTKTAGAVLHATRWLAWYGNMSESFSPAGGNRFGPDGLTGPVQKGQGLDAGLKFDLFEGKVALDLGYYDTSTVDAFERLNIQLRTFDSVYGTWEPIFATLNAPFGANQILNTSDPAALDRLKAAYPALRPKWLSDADLLDKASTGYEARLVANPLRGLRLRATYSNTSAEKQNLLKNTLVAQSQLNEYIAELKQQNPSVPVGSLSTTATGITIDQNLVLMDQYIQEAIDFNTNSFGSAKHRFNFNGTYDFTGRLRGWSAGFGVNYKSGSVVSSYQIINPAAPKVLLEEIPIYGASTMEWTGMIRYATRASWFGQRTRLSFQLNVTNLFDQHEPLVRRYNTIVVAPGATLPAPVGPTSLFLRAPRSWLLSAKLDL